MKIYSVTEGRKKLGELINQVKYQKKVIAIGKNGKADVLMVSFPSGENGIPITEMCAESESFEFLEDEPNLYSINDLKERYV
ncbi:type II toxin-antitoxin system Phd/YefM family antitoxin [Patescibacteria group bacterium]|nr:type II toxin-antitoxin system Phd/YefM family antitoxin [Patescibacteria group bacterium]MBU1123006.1 type II toxin-antitoxin system Phd/YefM family antitoxin [Patescibacteria group bacterium]MBU1911386.1 type II toxin-antitoxin system Phd/YefM family antitoxin [Patescibacteria group bacterium]